MREALASVSMQLRFAQRLLSCFTGKARVRSGLLVANEPLMEDPNSSPSGPNARAGVGIAIGIAMGVAIGMAMGNLAMGIGIGLALGIAMGAVSGKKES